MVNLPTKEGYHIKAFRTDKYNQDVPVNFTTDGNAVLSLAELTHTRIMADGATRYSRADTWFNAITPVFEADEAEPQTEEFDKVKTEFAKRLYCGKAWTLEALDFANTYYHKLP